MNILLILTGFIINTCGDSLSTKHEDGNLKICSHNEFVMINKNSLLSEKILIENKSFVLIKEEIVQFSGQETPVILKLIYLDKDCKLVLKTFSNNRSDNISFDGNNVSIEDVNLNIINYRGEITDSIQISNDSEFVLKLLRIHFNEIFDY